MKKKVKVGVGLYSVRGVRGYNGYFLFKKLKVWVRLFRFREVGGYN